MFVKDSEFEAQDIPRLAWIRVADAVKLLFDSNPKEHDIGGIIESFERYGIQEIPKISQHGVLAGNGRIECLDIMERDKKPLPRGLAQLKTGEWVMPVVVGVDLDSEIEARNYLIDANNLILSGGNFDHVDMSKLYNPDRYLRFLQDQEGHLPITVDVDDLKSLENIHLLMNSSPPEESDESESQEDDIAWPLIHARIHPELYQTYLTLTEGENDAERLEMLLRQEQAYVD